MTRTQPTRSNGGCGREGGRGGSSGRGAPSSSAQPTPSTTSDRGIGASVRDIQLTPSPSSSASVFTAVSEVAPTGRTTLTLRYGELYPMGMVPGATTKIFKQVKNPTGFNWKLTPDTVKKAFFHEFKKHFTWDVAIEEDIYMVWLQVAAQKYKDFVHDIKEKKNNPQKERPPFIHEDEWPAWLAYWDSDEVKDKSEIVKKCRMSEPVGPKTIQVKHKEGSMYILPNAEEVEKVQKIVVSQSPSVVDESDPPEINMSKEYVEAIGGLNKKKRMFGVSGLAAGHKSEESSSKSHFQGPTVDLQRLVELEQQLQEARRERDDIKDLFETLQEEHRQRDEQRQATNEAIQSQLLAQQRLIEMIAASLPPGPPGPSGPSS